MQRGIEVDLFATGDSQTSARLRWVAARAYSEDPHMDAKVWECLHIAALFERADQYDLIHNHFDFLPLTYSKLVNTPLLTTVHGFSSQKILPVYEKYNEHVTYIAISNAARHPSLKYYDTIYHGIPVERYPFCNKPEDYLLFLGRIHRDKGTYEAIQLAQRTGMPLIVAGIIQDQDYFDEYVEPFIDDETVKYVGPVGFGTKEKLLGRARGLLHLINCHEAFGLTVIEAMACGTPVLAINRGSMPELIRPGETGFLVDNLNEAFTKVQGLNRISRHRCRDWVKQRFSVELMVDRYLKTYKKIVQRK